MDIIKRFSDDKEQFDKNPQLNEMLKSCRGYEKKKLYAWVSQRGTLLSAPDDDYERILALKEEMQTMTESHGYVRLIEYKRGDTKTRLSPPPPPPDPNDKFRGFRGGHAIGGFTALTLDHILSEFHRIVNKHYAAQPFKYGVNKELKFYTKDDTVFMEHGNVRCWVRQLPENEREEDGEYPGYAPMKTKWSAHVTMIDRWNSDYHDVCVGKFRDGSDAVAEAFIAFLRFQIEEQYMDDFF